jgi:hypothetical protein
MDRLSMDQLSLDQWSMDPLPQFMIALAGAALFAGAAVHQALGWREWPGIVRNYRLLAEPLVGPVAIAIPLAEAASAASLLVPATRLVGALVAAALLSVFALALAINLRRGRTHIDCGCFGSRLRGPIGRWMVVRNAIFAALALSLLVPATARALSAWEVAAAWANVAALAFLYPVLGVVLAPRENLSRPAAKPRVPGAAA